MPPKSSSPSPSPIAIGMFDFLHGSTEPKNERKLDLGHFGALLKNVGLSEDDLSIYIVAYCVFEHSDVHVQTYQIPEKQFVPFMSAALKSRNVKTSDGNYTQAFQVLRQKVEEMAKSIRSDETRRTSFYYFLYTWALGSMDGISLRRKNEADLEKRLERAETAAELWNHFFYTPEAKGKSSSPPTYLHFVQFSRLSEWLAYIQTPDFWKENTISKDLWQQLLPFSSVLSYERHNPEDSWPVAIDEFVEVCNSKETTSA